MKSLADMMKEKGIEPLEVDEKEECELHVKALNNAKGDLDELDCPVCNNKGYVAVAKYEPMYGYHITCMKECECMSKRRMIKKAKKSGLGEYIHKRFKDYETDTEWRASIKSKALEYCKEDNKYWFVSLGQSGAGKTLISCIIANYLLMKEGKNVIYITWTDFISRLKRDMMSDNTNEVSTYLDEIKNVEVLYIDELLKKYNETDLKYIIEIINHRYTNNLKTIISSERTIDELLEIDEATFGRVIEKAEKFIINIPKDRSKNYRLRNIL